MAQDYIDSVLQRIIASAKNPEQLAGVKALFDQFVSGGISGFKFPSVIDAHLKGAYSGGDLQAIDEQLTALMLDADKRLRQSQLRFDITDLITPQEYALLQSGRGADGIGKELHTNPYKPMILRENPSTSIAAVNAQRAKRDAYGGWGLYFGLGEKLIKITLEPLNEKGETVTDPRPLDERLQPVAPYVKSPNFPFARS